MNPEQIKNEIDALKDQIATAKSDLHDLNLDYISAQAIKNATILFGPRSFFEGLSDSGELVVNIDLDIMDISLDENIPTRRFTFRDLIMQSYPDYGDDDVDTVCSELRNLANLADEIEQMHIENRHGEYKPR